MRYPMRRLKQSAKCTTRYLVVKIEDEIVPPRTVRRMATALPGGSSRDIWPLRAPSRTTSPQERSVPGVRLLPSARHGGQLGLSLGTISRPMRRPRGAV